MTFALWIIRSAIELHSYRRLRKAFGPMLEINPWEWKYGDDSVYWLTGLFDVVFGVFILGVI